jgi:purine-nucleoside phosphorylase
VIDVDTGFEEAIELWDRRGWPRPSAMLVSGSGLAVELGDYHHRELPLAEVLPFDTHAVEGHRLQSRLYEPQPGFFVLYQTGRLHSYQGYDAHQTVFSIRLGILLGVKTLVMTNAAGGLNPQFAPGQIVMIRDHINFIGMNPLRGELPPAWGPRFPDMGRAYDPDLLELARSKGAELGLSLQDGIYVGVAGPSYETPAEVVMLRRAGADLVGMSTVMEIIAARHMGARCLALSVVTNLAPGVGVGSTNHEEVLKAGKAAAGKLGSLLLSIFESPQLRP